MERNPFSEKLNAVDVGLLLMLKATTQSLVSSECVSAKSGVCHEKINFVNVQLLINK